MFTEVLSFLQLHSLLQLRPINKETCREVEFHDDFCNSYAHALTKLNPVNSPLHSPNEHPDPEGEAVLHEAVLQEIEQDRIYQLQPARSRSRRQAQRKRDKELRRRQGRENVFSDSSTS